MAVFEIATFSALAKLLLAARKLATDPDPLNRAKALADLAEKTEALNATIHGAGLSKLAQEIEARAQSLDSFLTHEGHTNDDARKIFWQAASHALADPSHLTSAALDAEATTGAMVAAIHDSPLARDFRQTHYAETYFCKVMTGTLGVMLAKKEFIDGITPALWRQTLTNHGIMIETVARIDSTTLRIEQKVGRLAQELTSDQQRAISERTGHELSGMVAIAAQSKFGFQQVSDLIREAERQGLPFDEILNRIRGT